MENIAYVRVSTVEQNEERQIEALTPRKIEKWFIEKISAKNLERPQYQAMMEYIREGDTVFVHDFSRLARSTEDLLATVKIFQQKGVRLVSNKENLDTTTPTGKLMLTMIAAINEFERENLLERQREGISIAKREGKYRGGQVKKIAPALFAAELAKYNRREQTKTQMAINLHISRPTLNRMIAEYSSR